MQPVVTDENWNGTTNDCAVHVSLTSLAGLCSHLVPQPVPMSPLDCGKATESLLFSLLEVMNTPNLGSLVV